MLRNGRLPNDACNSLLPFENSLTLKKFRLIITHNHESLIAPVLQTDPSADAGSHREMENAQALGIGVLCHSIPCSSPNAVNAIADRATARAHRQMRVKEGGLSGVRALR